MNKLFLLLLPHLVVGEGETGHVYGGIYVNEQSKTPDLHIESPDGGVVLIDGTDVLTLIEKNEAKMVTMVQFEARMAVLSEQLATQYKEKVSALEKNVTALKSQVAEDQAAATARILDLEDENAALQARVERMQFDLDSTFTSTTVTSTTRTTTTQTSTTTSKTATTLTTITTTTTDAPFIIFVTDHFGQRSGHGQGTAPGKVATIQGRQGKSIVVDIVAQCGVGGASEAGTNPSGPIVWDLRAANGNPFSWGAGQRRGGWNVDLISTPARTGPRGSGRGFVSKELTNGHKFPEGATLELHMTENNDSDGEYCYGRAPDGTMFDDSNTNQWGSRAWIKYHYE